MVVVGLASGDVVVTPPGTMVVVEVDGDVVGVGGPASAQSFGWNSMR
jgi:hypothetical protein